ncbi:MAG: alpha-glucosidase C-terminal domain-containing protein [Bacteroidales bacterium]|nr:alpha-glucosidase C-terminal domain-containing protein [Bacteroidales bacterium]
MKHTLYYFRMGVIILLIAFVSCTSTVQEDKAKKAAVSYPIDSQVKHVEWSKDAVIYEVNIRQHTEEGTFQAFTSHIPRLQEMGVDILWLMPVFPIGELNRKAKQSVFAEEIKDPAEQAKYLGSYYAIKDYMDVNPEYGTIEDFRELVETAHAAGMHVILDIAVNHTAWDHPWVTEKPEYYTHISADSIPWNPDWMEAHPEYYSRIRELGITYPIDQGETDWWDTADLNFDNAELRKELIKAFNYWVREFDIDGYRCDVAGWVPCDFWNAVRIELDKVKPVFMLAEDEAEACLLEKAFDMNYAWELHHIMNRIAQGKEDKTHLEAYCQKVDSLYDPDIYRMNFITNHDENSWNGTIAERMGDASKVFAMLSFTLPGMPLLYSGQEMGLSKRLKFFERDPMVWKDSPWKAFYTDLIKLKSDNSAFWNGDFGGTMKLIDFPDAETIFAFQRVKGASRFLVIANLSEDYSNLTLSEEYANTSLKDAFSGHAVNSHEPIMLGAWDYKILKLEE